jgi:hypothetical protein
MAETIWQKRSWAANSGRDQNQIEEALPFDEFHGHRDCGVRFQLGDKGVAQVAVDGNFHFHIGGSEIGIGKDFAAGDGFDARIDGGGRALVAFSEIGEAA